MGRWREGERERGREGGRGRERERGREWEEISKKGGVHVLIGGRRDFGEYVGNSHYIGIRKVFILRMNCRLNDTRAQKVKYSRLAREKEEEIGTMLLPRKRVRPSLVLSL